MSFLPFLIPINYCYRAYQSVCTKNLIEEVDASGKWVSLQKGTSRYNEAIKQVPGHIIKEELQPFFEELEVRNDLIVSESLKKGFGAAYGNNFCIKGDAAIILKPNFRAIDKDACHWTVMHEASHIKNSDSFTRNSVPAVCTLAAAIFTTVTVPMPVVVSMLATSAIGFVTRSALTQYRERKADDLANAKSTDDQLKGGRRILLSVQAFNVEKKTTTAWGRVMVSSSGENRLDIEHPSLKSRIQKVERALEQRNVFVDARDESVKIDRLKKFFSNVQSQIERELEKTESVR